MKLLTKKLSHKRALDRAYKAVRKNRLKTGINNLIWHITQNWGNERHDMSSALQAGTYHLSAQREYYIEAS